MVYFLLPSSPLVSLSFFFFRFLPTYQFLRVFYPTILWSFLWSMCRRRNGPFEKRRVSLLYYYQRCRDCVPANYFSSSHQPSAAFFPSGISLSTLRAFLLAPPFFPSLVSHLAPSFSLCFSFFPFCPLAGLKTEPECRLES